MRPVAVCGPGPSAEGRGHQTAGPSGAWVGARGVHACRVRLPLRLAERPGHRAPAGYARVASSPSKLAHLQVEHRTHRGCPLAVRGQPAPGFAVFPWTELTADEEEAIRRRQEREDRGWYPQALTPFQAEEQLEPLNSLGLCREGQVVGWMITHRTATDTIQYTSLFIDPALQGRGYALPLLAEAIRRQVARAEEIPFGIFQIDVANEPMRLFLDRYLRPYLSSLAELRRSHKRLRNRGGTS